MTSSVPHPSTAKTTYEKQRSGYYVFTAEDVPGLHVMTHRDLRAAYERVGERLACLLGDNFKPMLDTDEFLELIRHGAASRGQIVFLCI